MCRGRMACLSSLRRGFEERAVAAYVAYDRAMWHAANTPVRDVLIAYT